MLRRMVLWKILGTVLVSGLIVGRAVAADQYVDPGEIKDTLARAKALGYITACADPYDFPYSLKDSDPPGFDVEIMREVAKRGGMRLNLFWSNTGSRGGTSRAFRQSILHGKCDVFMGLSDNGDDDMLMGQLVFTKPYFGMGYVLVTQGKAAELKTMDAIKEAGLKIGVSMSTPMDDWLFENKIPRSLFFGSRREMEGLVKGEIDAAMLWSTSLGTAKVDFPSAQFKMVDGYVPREGLRFNANWVVRKEDTSLLNFINEGIGELLSNGRIKQIVESYGVPFYPPFSS